MLGCIIEDKKQDDFKVKCDQLKFKYWDKTDVVFHSEELGKRVGEYAIFKGNDHLLKQFYNQLFTLLNSAPIVVTAAIVDKDLAYADGWTKDTILQKASESIIMDFMSYLYGEPGSKGRVVYEASGYTRDAEYLKAYTRYLDPAWQKVNPDFTDVRQHLTSITFANKLNQDTEMQLADILSYAVVCKFKQKTRRAKYKSGSYEDRIIALLDKKTLRKPSQMSNKDKIKYYSKIKGVSYFAPVTSIKKPSTKK